MKKLFAIVAVMGVLTLGSTQLAQAQDAPAAEQTEQAAVAPAADAAAPAAMEATEGGIHKELKTKFIEGTASFMSLVAIALVIGLASVSYTHLDVYKRQVADILAFEFFDFAGYQTFVTSIYTFN